MLMLAVVLVVLIAALPLLSNGICKPLTHEPKSVVEGAAPVVCPEGQYCVKKDKTYRVMEVCQHGVVYYRIFDVLTLAVTQGGHPRTCTTIE